tara:strand:- start:454 stop:675 length:222 start_codon:yes stop_codon:yes gene_type:complete
VAVLTRSTVLESVVPVESTAKDHVNDATGKVGVGGSGSGSQLTNANAASEADKRILFIVFIMIVFIVKKLKIY